MNILVTGGAGYIGSITAFVLKQAGHQVVVYDHFKKRPEQKLVGLTIVKAETTDKEAFLKAFSDYQIEAVVHFAAYIEAGESMQDPGKYFANNVYGSLVLLEAMLQAKISKLVFSSTAALYGIPKQVPIKESDLISPVNAYGESKHMVEQMLAWYDKIHHLRSISLRYFNAAGSTMVTPDTRYPVPDIQLGEDHKPETHLIPNLILALLEKRPFNLFGDDYETADGTCIRDYIHVLDLAKAHVIALQALANGHQTEAYNVGTGNGFSNKEVIAMVEAVSGQNLNVLSSPRRLGDPDQLIADNTKFSTEFGWQPIYSDLRTIIESAWKWHKIEARS